MSYRPDEQDWMAYLYGELPEEEKRKFDQYLLQNPEAQKQLEQFQNIRGLLSRVEDKEVIAPPIVIGGQGDAVPGAEQRYLWTSRWFKAVAGIAASLILVIMAARITGLQLTVSDHELRLGFGQQSEPHSPQIASTGITEADVHQMIEASMRKNNEEIRQGLEETQHKLDASIKSNLALNSGKIDAIVRQASTASEQQIRQYVEGMREENLRQVKDYFQLNTTEQKKYIENLLVDFAKYLQQQRNDDLRLVQMRMNSLEQNTDIFKQETEQILTSIITTVGVPITEETRN